MTQVRQLLSARRASRLTSIPWLDLRHELERAGYPIYRVGRRERVVAADLQALIESWRRPTLAQSTDRVALAIDLVCEEMGIKVRRRRASPKSTPAMEERAHG